MRQRILAFAIVLVLGSGSLACTFIRGASAWGLNSSTNDYVIRMVGLSGSGATQVVDAWSLPAGSGGFTSTSHGLTVEVLDAATCALIATSPVIEDLLIDVDERGAVSFISEGDRPAIKADLVHTTACVNPSPS